MRLSRGTGWIGRNSIHSHYHAVHSSNESCRGLMESVANDLQSALNVAERLRQIPDEEASIRPAPGKWSKKEILGHLIDSAANNHQRFLRLQLSPRLDL